MSKKGKAKTSIKIDPYLWKLVKIEAIRRDLTVSDLLEEALKKELNVDVKESEVKEDRL